MQSQRRRQIRTMFGSQQSFDSSVLFVACIPSKPGRARTLGLLNRPYFAIWSTYLPFWQLFLNIFDIIHVHREKPFELTGTTRHSHKRHASRWPYKLGPREHLDHQQKPNFSVVSIFVFSGQTSSGSLLSLGRFLHLDLLLCADGVSWLTRALGTARDHVLRCRQVGQTPKHLAPKKSSVISFVSSDLSPRYDTAFF